LLNVFLDLGVDFIHFYDTIGNFVHYICALLEYYAASNGNHSPTFRDNVWAPSLRVKKSRSGAPGTDTLCRNVCKGLPFDVV
jgi:hypothetical protein